MITLKSTQITEDKVHEVSLGKFNVNIHSKYIDGVLTEQYIKNIGKKYSKVYNYQNMRFYILKPGVSLVHKDEKDYYKAAKEIQLIEPENITEELLDLAYCPYQVMDGFNYKLGTADPLPRWAAYSISIDDEYGYDKHQVMKVLDDLGVKYDKTSYFIYFQIYENEEDVKLASLSKLERSEFIANKLGFKKFKEDNSEKIAELEAEIRRLKNEK